jgi:hypothetical protein
LSKVWAGVWGAANVTPTTVRKAINNKVGLFIHYWSVIKHLKTMQR